MYREQMEFDDAIPPGAALIIVNPESGTKSFKAKTELVAAARTRLHEHGWEVADPVTTQAPGHATELAAEAVKQGVNIILVAGGDGTVQEILDPLANTDTAVGMLKAGGQNLWAREYGIPADPIKAVDVQLAGGVVPMDLGSINGKTFRLLAGVGFDGEVVYAAHGQQAPYVRRPATSRLQYGLLTNHMFREARATTAEISVDGKPPSEVPLYLGWIENTTLLSNALTYMQLRPEGRTDDGRMELTVLPKVGKVAFARATVPAGIRYAVHHDGKRLPFGMYSQGSNFTIRTEDSVHAHVDGSPLSADPTTVFSVETRPQALKVLTPRRSRSR